MFDSSNLTSAIRQRWLVLIGSPSDFTLERRIFHSTSLGISFLTFLYFPYNIYAGMYIAAISCLVFGGIFFNEYYRSRFLLKPHRSLLFGISGLIILSINYFANAGIQGSTDLIWPVYLLLLLTICPYQHMVTWVIIYLIVFGCVHVIENQFPELVQYPFSIGNGQFTDRITAFPLPVISMAIIIGLFRRNYDKERTIASHRDSEKNKLLSILSHDLRAPFIQVQQYFEMLDNDLLSGADRIHLETALKKTNDQTLNLVTNLLYWSRSQMSGFSIRLGEITLHETLKNTLEIAKGLSIEKGIEFNAKIQPDIVVNADADMLQLVVRNLLQNAIKFTSPNGLIGIETEIANNSCLIKVTDNGNGIHPDLMENIFSGTTPTTGTANEKGVGLGLQLCKDFMVLQRGNIAVESSLGTGSEFTIIIPLASKSADGN